MKSVKPTRLTSKPEYAKRKANLLPEVAAETDENGVYTISLPTPVKSYLEIDGKRVCDTIQLKCNSLCVRRNDTVCKCNSTVTTIVGAGTGDQCEIIECGKCRTAYMVRKVYDKQNHLKLNISVWDTCRNLKNLSRREHDDDLNFQVRFNK